jgi:type VI secretion system secreted protein VgrG
MTAFARRTSSFAVCAAFGFVLAAGGGEASAATSPVGLGTAASYAVVAATTVTNTGPSTVVGNIGLSPGTAVTGFPPGLVTDGVIHAADAPALDAQAAVVTAYNDAAGRPSTGSISADLAGMTLTDGVYTGGALLLSGTLTLDAQGDPNAVFVFQAASTLITASSSSVSLINGAGACNVFWQVGSSATIGTSSAFVGTVLALTSISAQTNASIQGRLLARNGAVTLDSNTFTRPLCQTATTPTTTIAATGGTTATTAATGGTTATTAAAGGTTSVPRIPSVGSNAPGILAAAAIAFFVGAGAVIAARRSPHRSAGR